LRACLYWPGETAMLVWLIENELYDSSNAAIQDSTFALDRSTTPILGSSEADPIKPVDVFSY